MIIRVAPPEHHAWIAARARVNPGADFRAIEAVSGGRILGMVAFDGWTPNACCLHIALDAPIALRGLVKQGFGIAFDRDHLNRGVVFATVLGDNERSLRLVKHLGFRPVGRSRDGWSPGVDLTFWELRREECRFLDVGRKGPENVEHNRVREAA